ncbi:phage tail protein [Stenotrophomonas rhizophila]|uniref:phage tail protein n=1 Tax=Stenotrophomonas rhizophila TaxID=216778 RepID=UPI001E428F59|nr:phage tail protein [Stenotrophomonas rhizophila]MCC7632581.1 phage tail protein [Stenotrophomonas rhizophila]MCC7663433.1 phage tail protein [Stenotrophomonas rhizophila]
MIKPGSLRDHLLAAVPGLLDSPDRLLVFVEDGKVQSSYEPGLSFQILYTLSLILTDYAGSPDSVMLPLLQWVTRHQPELLANPAHRDGIAFDVDVLANDLVDVALKLPLSERVVVVAQADGTFLLNHVGEPPTEDYHAQSLAGGAVLDAAGVLVATLPDIPLV